MRGVVLFIFYSLTPTGERPRISGRLWVGRVVLRLQRGVRKEGPVLAGDRGGLWR